ncbi:hypothetical protein M408DRAFT_67165 [Serendipita vermifera MAFF 305830]|uniref:Major facilitator superfamily (MFS) profile domain-containing protein n=1 Tax=Serendipita vermifera MAFF 305830 TaxID=933852 RepID=A0A0C3AZJ6_SERVB|nr:hypothetical protein M408DRAFT_67165 [Serendipita vermifera MAFF 305830]
MPAGHGSISKSSQEPVPNIENTQVDNDPQLWSPHKKLIILAIISFASLAPTTGAFIYQPAIKVVEADLQASTNEIALSLSLFILVQGSAPLIWSSISEIKGRKFVYVIAMIIFIIGSAIGGASKTMVVLICMRIFQAAGSSAVLALGAGTLADIYAPRERGTMMGIYYAAPLLGPSLGPLIGGAITEAFNWRATFYFLSIIGGIVLLSLLIFHDTFRRERSLTYAAAQRHAVRRTEEKLSKKRQANSVDSVEKGRPNDIVDPATIKVTLVDLNPFKPIWYVLKRKNNLMILFPSAILFALQYSVCFTAARTFGTAPYNYSPLQIGLVLLAFGGGNMCGSVLGGKWSDITYRRLRAKNENKGWPEMRLKSTRVIVLLAPLSILAYGWTVQKHTHVAGPIVSLFISGFSVLFVYSSTLAYIVDANAGRSTAAVASNSCFRGVAGMVASEIAAPLQDAIGDGGLYSMWAGLLLGVICMIWVVILKGKAWREEAEKEERANRSRSGGTSTPALPAADPESIPAAAPVSTEPNPPTTTSRS